MKAAKESRLTLAAAEKIRELAIAEVTQLYEAALAALAQAEAPLARADEVIRAGLRRVGGKILEAAVAVLGRGYEGSRKACSCGARGKYMGDRARQLVCLSGELRIKRSYYWCPACGGSQAPLDERLGITGSSFSAGAQQAMGRLGACLPFAEGRQIMQMLTGISASKRTHENTAEAIGASLLLQPAPKLPAAESVPLKARPKADEDLYLSIDGTMAPLLKEWREVKLGAIYYARRGADGLPERTLTRYLGDIAKAENFGEQVYRETCALGLSQARRMIIVGDGAAWIWNLAATHFPEAIQILDRFHANERLWLVSKTVFGEGAPETAAWADQAQRLLDQGRVSAVIEKMGRLRPGRRKSRQVISEAMAYFHNNIERMRYKKFRQLGLFVGSGVIEAGGKHIVGMRFKQSGMRWSEDGLRKILALRLAVLNGDWPKKLKPAA